jgi:hypothetical protein
MFLELQCAPGRLVAHGDSLGKQWIITPLINGEHLLQTPQFKAAKERGHAECMEVLNRLKDIYVNEIVRVYETCNLVHNDIKNGMRL